MNDAGVQIDRLGESLEARWRERRGEAVEIPEGGYHGAYLEDLAAEVDTKEGERLRAVVDRRTHRGAARLGVGKLRSEQDQDLREFGVVFDHYFFESTIYHERKNEETLADAESSRTHLRIGGRDLAAHHGVRR